MYNTVLPINRRGCVLVWTLAVVAAGIGAVEAEPAPILLHQYRCYACHSDHETKTGPPYADVAAKYKSNPRAVAILASELKTGMRGGGPWHMPPHPEVSNADAREMARYILSLKK